MIRIVAPHFVAGIDPETGNIAPIIKYMAHWSLSTIKAYCAKKGWKVEIIK